MLYNKCRKGMLLLILTALLLGTLFGCKKARVTTPSLWVVTEETEWNRMNYQVRVMNEVFQAEHPGWTVKFDVLPRKDPDRGQYLKQLRSWTMAGKGPDVFLLPTETTVVRREKVEGSYLDEYVSARMRATDYEPLFRDVERVMNNGIFADISAFYDADDALGTERFNKQIMDAGVYNGGRYILPLRYNFPVLYVDPDGLEKWGLTLEDVSGNIPELLNVVIASGDQDLACSAEPYILRMGRGFSVLPAPIQYAAETVTVTKEEVSSLLRQIQSVEALVGEQNEHRRKLSIWSFMQGKMPILTNGNYGKLAGYYELKRFPTTLPMQIDFFDSAALVTVVNAAADQDFTMLPLRGAGDEMTAYVTWYGAIGADCGKVEEAYEYLRLFLTERAQFEQDTPVQTSIWVGMNQVAYRDDYIADGWPVRVWGGTNEIWNVVRLYSYGVTNEGGIPLKKKKLLTTRLTDDDLPLLQTKFDRVYFGNVLEQEFARMVRSLNDPYTGEPADVDIDAMAENFVKELRWQVMEG